MYILRTLSIRDVVRALWHGELGLALCISANLCSNAINTVRASVCGDFGLPHGAQHDPRSHIQRRPRPAKHVPVRSDSYLRGLGDRRPLCGRWPRRGAAAHRSQEGVMFIWD